MLSRSGLRFLLKRSISNKTCRRWTLFVYDGVCRCVQSHTSLVSDDLSVIRYISVRVRLCSRLCTCKQWLTVSMIELVTYTWLCLWISSISTGSIELRIMLNDSTRSIIMPTKCSKSSQNYRGDRRTVAGLRCNHRCIYSLNEDTSTSMINYDCELQYTAIQYNTLQQCSL